ncbi:MAG: type IV pilin-like G/H family protein [Leptolyngbyaceae bacterium]|nr:type IV pilin-like G/H family protein [Leptolyngbyaceae bacterium]
MKRDWAVFFTLFTSGCILGLNSCSVQRAIGANGLEAKQYVGSMNRAQQAYYVEFNRFGQTIPDLQLGIKTKTDHYEYSTQATPKAAFNFGKLYREEEPKLIDLLLPWLKRPSQLKSYVGGVFVVPPKTQKPQSSTDTPDTISVLCETVPGLGVSLPKPRLQNGIPVCGEGTIVSR